MTTADNDSYIIQTMSHEITHWAEKKAPELYAKLRTQVIETLAKTEKVDAHTLILAEKEKLPAEQRERGEEVTEISDELAMSELVARSCEQMLGDSTKAKEMLQGLTEAEQKTFIGKIKETIKNFLDC